MMAKDTQGKKRIQHIDTNEPDDFTTFAVEEVKKGHVRNTRPLNMSLDEPNNERAKKKAELFNRLYKLQSRRGIAKFNNIDEMQLLVDDYFSDCVELGLRPTIRGLATALGTGWNTLNDWENGSRDAQLGSGCSLLVKKAKQFIAEYDELMALEGLDNPVLFMFRSKNYYGLSDKQEITVTPNQQLQSSYTPDEILESIEQDIPLHDD